MAVRFKRSGTNHGATDHNQLLNKGDRTHAEIDLALAELDKARGSYIDLDARLLYIQEHSTGGGGGSADVVVVSNTRLTYPAKVRSTNQRLFETPAYVVGGNTLEVYLDGVLVDLTDDYNETDGTHVTFQYDVRPDQSVTFKAPISSNEIVRQVNKNSVTASAGSPFSFDIPVSTLNFNFRPIQVLRQKGAGWAAAVHGVDYDYEYPSITVLTVKLYTSGNFKINY